MKHLLIAHDLGTSGNKATLFDVSGKLLSSCTQPYPTTYYHGSWAEQDPEAWWKAVCVSTRRILADYDPQDVACVSFSGQMMGCLAVDKKGNPLYPHILYCDQRAVQQTERLIKKIPPKEIFNITGHRPSPSYSIEKLMWLKDQCPDVYQETYKMLHAKDYINFRLTGRMVTEYNDASGTNAFDLHSLRWSEKIIEAAGIDMNKLPEAVSSPTIIGEITKEASQATGLSEGTPVAAGAGDGGCATVGIGAVQPGITYNYLGSSSWIATTSKVVLKDPAMKNFTWIHPVPGYLQPCGTMQTACGSYEWMHNELALFERNTAKGKKESSYDLIDALIATSPPGAKGLVFLPYLLGERSPRWNPEAKGGWIGLTVEHQRADMFRSVLEGVAANLSLILDVMRSGLEVSSIRLIGGGGQSRQWQQILADVYEVPVEVPNYLEEATSMGAAVIGGVASGALDSFERAEDFIDIVQTVHPRNEYAQRYQFLKDMANQIYDVLEPLFPRLSEANRYADGPSAGD